MKYRALFLAIIFICIATCFIMTNRTYSKTEKNAPLLCLFSKELGLTLIGEKPMSCEECIWDWDSPLPQRGREEFISWLNERFQNSSKYIFRTHTYRPGHIDIVLIHKPSFQKVFKRTRYLNKFIKRHYGDVENFFSCCERSSGSFSDWFKNDDIALGIALGYGYNNSTFLSRCNDLSTCVNKNYGLVCRALRRKGPHPFTASYLGKSQIMMISIPRLVQHSANWPSAQDELLWLESIVRAIPQSPPPYLFSVPFFVARQGQETEELLRKYEKGINRLARLFQSDNAAKAIQNFVEKPETQNHKGRDK